MPLSEHEQKMLDEMERQLFAEDPRLARAFAPSRGPRRSGRRILIGLAGVVVGLGVLVLSVSLNLIWLGVIAFIGMLGGALYAITGSRGATEPDDSAPGNGGGGGSRPTAPRGGDDFLRKMEQRWERRSGEDPRG